MFSKTHTFLINKNAFVSQNSFPNKKIKRLRQHQVASKKHFLMGRGRGRGGGRGAGGGRVPYIKKLPGTPSIKDSLLRAKSRHGLMFNETEWSVYERRRGLGCCIFRKMLFCSVDGLNRCASLFDHFGTCFIKIGLNHVEL